MKYKLLFLAICFNVTIAFSQNKADTVSVDALEKETTIAVSDDVKIPHHTGMVLWLNEEWWQALLQGHKEVPTESKNTILTTMGRYDVLAVIDLINDSGYAFKYTDRKTILNYVKMMDKYGGTIKPYSEEEYEISLTQILNILKPMLQSYMGNMASHIEFIVYPAWESATNRYFDPYKSGSFHLKYNSIDHFIRLPLGSLLKPKWCKKCKEMRNGSWTYCPYDGSLLEEK